MSPEERRAALEAAGQLALDLGEWTLDPEQLADDDLDALIEAAAAEWYDGTLGAGFELLAGYGRPATRPPKPADRWRVLYRLDEVPSVDLYEPPANTAAA